MNSATVASARPLINWPQAAAAAAGWCTAVLLISVTGVLIAQGHDGLAYTLGIAGAAFLWAAVIVPAMSGTPAPQSLPSYLSGRYASPAVGQLSRLVLLVALAGLLAAEVTALSSVLALAGLASHLALAATLAGAIGGFGLTVSGRDGALASAIFMAGVACTLLTVLLAGSYHTGPGALVSIPAMADIASLEQTLLEKRLADPATFKPHGVPFLRTGVLNFAMLIVCLSLGLALLATPRIGAPSSNPASQSYSARCASRAFLLVAAIIVLLPPLAAAAKRALLALFASGVRPAALPDWMTAAMQAGMLQICGAQSASPAVLAKACGKGVGPQGLMRWHDAIFAPEALLFAGLQAGSPAAAVLAAALIALAVVATVWTSRRILSLVVDVAAMPLAVPGLARFVATLVLVAAALIAYAKPADSVTLMTWSASLAAAGLAPVVLTAILVRSPNANSAMTAIVVGALTAALLTLAARFAPVDLFAWTGAASSAPPAVTRRLATLQDAWAAAADGPGRAALRLQAETLARDNLNWFGVKPVSAGVFGLALGGIIVLIGSFVASLTRRKAIE
ncbi:MAG: hypothetical protein ABL901_10980 [Hyphomicrobiaceae bacterium]